MAVAGKSVCPGKSPPSPFAIVFAVSEPTSFSPLPSPPLAHERQQSLSFPSLHFRHLRLSAVDGEGGGMNGGGGL